MALFGRLFGKAKPVPVARPVFIPTAQKVTRRPGMGPLPVAPVVNIPTAQKVKKPRFVVGRGSAPAGTRENPEARIPEEHLTEFLSGEEVGLTSSWLATARYDADAQEMHITFLNGHSVRVLEFSSWEAAEFFQSASKGGWYHNFVLGPAYIMGDRSTGRKMVIDE